MLQNIRKNMQGAMAKVVVAIIVVPFALFGIESLIGGGTVPTVAEVNGQPISASELQQEINRRKRQMMLSMGDEIDQARLDDQALAGPSLDFMVGKLLLLQAAESLGLAVPERRMEDLIMDMEAFQVDGRFDSQRYRALLSDMGHTSASFAAELREGLLLNQLQAGLSGSEFTTPAELARLATLEEERRDIRYLLVPLDGFKDAASVSDEAVLAWYEERSDSYQSEESVDLEYLELRLEDFQPEISEQAVRELFEQEKEQLLRPEQRAVSHILFEQGEGETDAELQARIAEVAEQVSADAANFAELAKRHSQDLGSANFGGELGYTSGDSFPPAIESAVTGLPLHVVSEPVQSDAGWHLLLVTEIREREVPTFDEVRMELELRLLDETARKELLKASESLRDLAFNAEDLAGPAAELGLEVRRQEGIARSGNSGIFADARVSEAAFSDELLREGYNSEVFELADDHFLVLRVAEHHPVRQLSLEQVRDDVVGEILESQAREEALAHTESLLARLREGASLEELALANDHEWREELGAARDSQDLPPATLERAFALQPPTDGPVFDYVQTDGGDVELFEISRVTSGDVEALDERRRERMELAAADSLAVATYGAFQKTLAEGAEVARN